MSSGASAGSAPAAAGAVAGGAPGGDPVVRRVWAAAACGSMATEIFTMSLVFVVVDRAGAEGSRYLVPQLLAAALSGLLAGRLLSRVLPFTVVTAGDWSRCVAALAALVGVAAGLPLGVVVAGAVLIAAVRPHHDAGVMSGLSSLRLPREQVAHAAAVVDNTLRAARVLGPGVAALLALVGGPEALLGTSAALFAGAALLFGGLRRRQTRTAPAGQAAPEPAVPGEPAHGGVSRRLLAYVHLTQAVNHAAWYLGFVFCVALVLAKEGTADVAPGLGTLGLVTLCYGLGNVAAGLLLTRFPPRRTLATVVLARAGAGVSYLLLAASHRLVLLCVCATLAALFTPPADLAFIRYVQTRRPWQGVARSFRTKLVSEYSGSLIAVSGASVLIGRLGPRGTIAAGGAALLAVAALGPLLAVRAAPWGQWPGRSRGRGGAQVTGVPCGPTVPSRTGGSAAPSRHRRSHTSVPDSRS